MRKQIDKFLYFVDNILRRNKDKTKIRTFDYLEETFDY